MSRGWSQLTNSVITYREKRCCCLLLTNQLVAGQVLERRWFANRRCLDIGCNEGLVTLAVAARFGAASMLGVDLDEHLIRNACRHGTPMPCLRARRKHVMAHAEL